MQFLRKVGWLNLLLALVPIAIVLELTHAPPKIIFLCAATAIIPLAGLMGKSTEMLAERLGPGIGGLLNASFGNAAEMIIAVFALKAGLVNIVKASITGSIIGNVLLVLGLSFLAGGVRFKNQRFNATAAGMSATLLVLAAVGLLTPALFHLHLTSHHFDLAVEQDVSLEIALVLFGAYIFTLLFSLKTHKHLYEATLDEDAPAPRSGGPAATGAPRRPTEPAIATDAGHAAALHGGGPHGHEPWRPRTALIVLLTATALVALMSEFLVGAINETSQAMGWTELFVGVIVIAVVGNAAEHSTAVLVAMKNEMDLAYQIAVGSGLQIALFVAPVLVFVSYLPGFPRLDLVFSMLEVAAIASSVAIVGFVAYDGRSNWLEGVLLLAVYAVIAIAFFNLPESPKEARPPASAGHVSPALPSPAVP